VDLAVESVFSWLRERIVFSEFLLNSEPALYCVSKYCRVYRSNFRGQRDVSLCETISSV